MTAVRDPRRAASARALRASGNFWSRSYSSAGAEAGGAGGGARGRMCAAERVARRLRALHTVYRVHSMSPALPENCRCIVRPLDVASAVASDRVQHAGRARHDRCKTHTERRSARGHFALALRPAGRHFCGARDLPGHQPTRRPSLRPAMTHTWRATSAAAGDPALPPLAPPTSRRVAPPPHPKIESNRAHARAVPHLERAATTPSRCQHTARSSGSRAAPRRRAGSRSTAASRTARTLPSPCGGAFSKESALFAACDDFTEGGGRTPHLPIAHASPRATDSAPALDYTVRLERGGLGRSLVIVGECAGPSRGRGVRAALVGGACGAQSRGSSPAAGRLPRRASRRDASTPGRGLTTRRARRKSGWGRRAGERREAGRAASLGDARGRRGEAGGAEPSLRRPRGLSRLAATTSRAKIGPQPAPRPPSRPGEPLLGYSATRRAAAGARLSRETSGARSPATGASPATTPPRSVRQHQWDYAGGRYMRAGALLGKRGATFLTQRAVPRRPRIPGRPPRTGAILAGERPYPALVGVPVARACREQHLRQLATNSEDTQFREIRKSLTGFPDFPLLGWPRITQLRITCGFPRGSPLAFVPAAMRLHVEVGSRLSPNSP